MKFDVNIQSPFKSTIDKYPNQTKEDAALLFKSIDWKGLWDTIMASGSSQESDYYYYEVSYQNNIGEKFMLHVACTIGENVCLRFFRPKTVMKTVWFKKKEVFEPQFETQMDDVPVHFAYNCLMAFLNENNLFLENNIEQRIIDLD